MGWGCFLLLLSVVSTVCLEFAGELLVNIIAKFAVRTKALLLSKSDLRQTKLGQWGLVPFLVPVRWVVLEWPQDTLLGFF